MSDSIFDSIASHIIPVPTTAETIKKRLGKEEREQLYDDEEIAFVTIYGKESKNEKAKKLYKNTKAFDLL